MEPCRTTHYKFNIVCTSGAIQYVPLFALSLHKWSDCSFRLVVNGCLPAEIKLLEKFCDKDTKFELRALPTKNTVPHGQVLSYLQTQESSDTFCFMDSDILATGHFLDEFTPYLTQHAGIFSGAPVWLTDEEKVIPVPFQEMAGRYSRTDRNMCLGSSYFAIYDNQVLTRTIESTGINLNRYEWNDIPAKYQKQLIKMGIQKTGYDTGKLLNILLQSQGESILFQKSDTLHHIGGISTVALDYASLMFQIRVFLSQLPILKRIPMPKPGNRKLKVSTSELLAMREVRLKKIKTCHYIGKLLNSLHQGYQPPGIPHFTSQQINQRIQQLTTHIVVLYEEFQEYL